jgi:hypothetical protein
MSIPNVGTGTTLVPGSIPSGRFFLPGASAFADTLNIGQIIQGRVLRGFEDSRYLVAFGNDERVVESATPLTTGDILHGRVVGIGDRVELQRIYAASQEKALQRAATAPEGPPRAERTTSADGTALEEILQRYQITLSDSDRTALLRAMRAADDSEAMSLAGAMLSKLGLPQANVLLNALYEAQLTPSSSTAAKAVESASIPQVVVPPEPTAQLQLSSVQGLADLLRKILEVKTSEDRGNADGVGAGQSTATASFSERSVSGKALMVQNAVINSTRPRDALAASDDSQRALRDSLADRILNAQTGGVVSHRSGLLPLLVGGRLVEVSFALFEQKKPATQAQGLQHRQVVFSLRTEQLGRVDVLARITGAHVRVQITTNAEDSTSRAAQYNDSLKSALSESGWSVDEVAYGIKAQGAPDSAVRSVIEHVVSLDSLNRLV